MVTEEEKKELGTLVEPGFITQGMALLEDIGIAKPLNGTQYDFTDGMNTLGFKIPEAIIWATVFVTAIITVIGLTIK